MNMNKALQKLYKAISKEDNHKVNISKLLVDIHYALTGKVPTNKNNHAKIISELADNWSDGGGGGGSSDFSTAEVTVVESEIGFVSDPYTMSIIIEELGVFPIRVRAKDESQNFIVPLYKGMASFAASENVIVSGDATYDENYRLVHISGDCSIKGQLSY